MTKRTPPTKKGKAGTNSESSTSISSDEPSLITINENREEEVTAAALTNESQSLNDINSKKRKLSGTIQGDSEQSSDYLKVISFFEKKFDDLKQFNNELVKNLEESLKNNQVLLDRVDQLENNEEFLKSEVDQLRSQVNDLEQSKLRNNIIIRNIEHQNNENIYDLTSRVLTVVGKSEASNQISSCYRIKNRNASRDPGSIVVSFTNPFIKDTVLELKTSLRIINSDIGFEKNNSQIYIQEHLSYHNQELFYFARQLRKFGYRFVWSKFGKIYVRKSTSTKTVWIRSKEQVDKLLSKESQSVETPIATSQLPQDPLLLETVSTEKVN